MARGSLPGVDVEMSAWAESDEFRPLFCLTNPHVQTIAATFGLARPPSSEVEVVDLPDGDRILLEVTTPDAWAPRDPTAVLVHGLCGCSRSGYCVRLARKLTQLGTRAVRMNLRGCGPGRGLARKIYHSGRSEDVLAVLEALRARHPESPTTLVGFSLGGNIVLKLAGEMAQAANGVLRQVIAVGPPVDLKASAERLSHPRNRLYDRFFVRLLIKAVRDRHSLFPDLPRPTLPRKLRLVEFDDVYTAPTCGFAGAMDYYERASSAQLLRNIAVPARVLVADDDPLVDSSTLYGLHLPPNVKVTRTLHGGHLGFLGRDPRGGGLRWMDGKVLEWILEQCPAHVTR